MAVADLDNEQMEANEISFRAGDRISDVRRVEGGVFEGKDPGGKRGIYPELYAKAIPGKETGGESSETNNKKRKRCRVLFSYQPAQDDELRLEINDIIDFNCEVEDGWWKGSINGKTGVFPSNFVELIPLDEERALVADKNKKNKEQLSSKPSSFITKNVSSGSKERIDSVLSDSRVPKLPPKPVKEQCIVQYPYTAQNNDELTLMEGQIVTVLSKDSEDKGWWRGEIDGNVGVFPDNFVKLLPSHEIPSGNKKHGKLSFNRDSGSIRGSKEKIGSNTAKGDSPKFSPIKKHSFGKSNPPPKPKAPCPAKTSSSAKVIASAVNIGQPSKSPFISVKSSLTKNSTNRSSFSKADSESTINYKMPSSEPPKGVSLQADEEDDSKMRGSTSSLSAVGNTVKQAQEFECVTRNEKLAHPTADRVKGPKRRPPSSVFVKEFIALDEESEVDDKTSDASTSSENLIERKSSSFIREMKEALQNTSNGNIADAELKNISPKEDSNNNSPSSKTSSPIHSLKEELQNRLENNDTDVPSSKKPEWLEELSRKQAHRKSGIFPERQVSSRASAPLVSTDKPQLPTKPSQIRDDVVRKFNKRASNIEAVSGSDKENSKPNRPMSVGASLLNHENSLTNTFNHSFKQITKISTGVGAVDDDSKTSPSESKTVYQSPSSDQCNLAKETSSSFETEQTSRETLSERVFKLEGVVRSLSEQVNFLTDSLKQEKEERLKLLAELEKIKN